MRLSECLDYSVEKACKYKLGSNLLLYNARSGGFIHAAAGSREGNERD